MQIWTMNMNYLVSHLVPETSQGNLARSIVLPAKYAMMDENWEIDNLNLKFYLKALEEMV